MEWVAYCQSMMAAAPTVPFTSRLNQARLHDCKSLEATVGGHFLLQLHHLLPTLDRVRRIRLESQLRYPFSHASMPSL